MEFDVERFREWVLYIVWRTKDDPQFGRTKVAKTLFYADFGAYADEGQPLTGATYEHWQFGPFPPVLYEVEEGLVADGRAALEQSEFAGDESKLIALDEPDIDRLPEWERTFVDMKIQEIARERSWRVSDLSHEHPGWIATGDREQIPYEAALISPDPPSPEVLDLAQRRFAGS
jgi:uncharacterized phage-associated protein